MHTLRPRLSTKNLTQYAFHMHKRRKNQKRSIKEKKLITRKNNCIWETNNATILPLHRSKFKARRGTNTAHRTALKALILSNSIAFIVDNIK